MKYIDKKLEEYFEAADKLDEEEQGEEQAEAWEALSGRVEDLLERRGKYEKLEKRLEQSEERQISTTDKDARALPLHMGIVEVGYNIQTATDDKHCLIADYEVTNEKDDYALAKIGNLPTIQKPTRTLARRGKYWRQTGGGIPRTRAKGGGRTGSSAISCRIRHG